MWSKPLGAVKHCIVGVLLGAWTFSAALSSQIPGKVDFRRDVQPLLKQHCIDCHGPSQQMNGFRLDRRRDALRGGTIAVIAPGNSAGSRLYHKLTLFHRKARFRIISQHLTPDALQNECEFVLYKVIGYASEAIKPLANPLDPKKYSADLVSKHLEWVGKWQG